MNPIRTLTLLALSLSVTHSAETRRVFLGNIDLAGLVPHTLPARGEIITLTDTEHPVLDQHRKAVGYLPVLFRQPLEKMIARGIPIRLEVEHRYQTPRPGRFLRVTLWADTTDLSQIEPLIYHIPIHSEKDLSDYE